MAPRLILLLLALRAEMLLLALRFKLLLMALLKLPQELLETLSWLVAASKALSSLPSSI